MCPSTWTTLTFFLQIKKAILIINFPFYRSVQELLTSKSLKVIPLTWGFLGLGGGRGLPSASTAGGRICSSVSAILRARSTTQTGHTLLPFFLKLWNLYPKLCGFHLLYRNNASGLSQLSTWPLFSAGPAESYHLGVAETKRLLSLIRQVNWVTFSI